MVSLDLTAAHLSLNVYQGPGSDTWDHFDPGLDDGICWGIKTLPDQSKFVALRGSDSFPDWIRDLLAFANPYTDALYGPVHPGFFLGMQNTWNDIKPLVIGCDWHIGGHSLGAGRAADLTAIAAMDGRPPKTRIVFGEPKSGFQKLAGMVVAAAPGRSYCNGDAYGHDLVTDLPFSFPPEEYVRASPLIQVSAVPSLLDPWGVFRFHHMELYLAALTALEPTV